MGEMDKRALSRRRLLTAAGAGASAAGLAGVGEAQTTAGQGERLTASDLAAGEKLWSRPRTEEERNQMVGRMNGLRAASEALRRGPSEEAPPFHFDPRLPGVTYPAPAPRKPLRRSSAGVVRYDGRPESLAFATVSELGRLLREKKVTSVALTRMYLERLKRYGPRLECVVTLTEDLAMTQAERADREIAGGRYRGPLHGIPWGAKDLLATRGIRTTWGAKPYEHQVFDYDATVVTRLEAAGAVLLAKLTLGELAWSDRWFGGQTRCPWDPSQGSSGSSAGPGSAVAAGLVGFAIGSETHGSIVSPSVQNGVVGLRPTYGRVPRTGAMALAWTMDKIGPMTRGIEDCALVLDTIFGPDGRDLSVADVPFQWNAELPLQKLRVGFDKSAFEAVEKGKDEPRKETYRGVLQTLRELGIKLVPVAVPPANAAYQALPSIVLDCECASAFAELVESPRIRLLARQESAGWPTTFRIGATIPAVDYLQAMRVRARLQRDMAAALREVDVMVTVPFEGPILAYTNMTGHPSLIARCGVRDGKPLSVEFIGGLYQEAHLLRVGLAFERARPRSEWPDLEKTLASRAAG